jgi:amidase
MAERDLTRRDLARLAGAAAAAPAGAASAPELCFLSAAELAARLRARKISALEVMEAHLKQIERVNPKVNAIVTLAAEQALAAARRADAEKRPRGPLHGLPIAHKDLEDTKGMRTTYGSPLFRDHVPAEDALLVARLRAAGAIALGKTNTPEFGAGSQTFNQVFGATRNPYDLTKTCGGSSGGAAVALACGMVPIADGSDTGGSLRNPASFCNVVGFRVAPGRVPRKAAGLAFSPLSVEGPMARSVADAALLLSALAGPDPRCPIAISEPGSIFAAKLDRAFRGVRVAFFKDLGGLPFDPRVRAVIEAQQKVFRDLGCAVEVAEPDFAGADEAFKILRAQAFAANHGEKVRQHRDRIKTTIQWEVDRGTRLTAPEINRAESLRAALWNRFQEFLERYEYFVLPVSQVPPFDVNQEFVTEIAGVKMETYIDWMKSCWYISLTGNPAISVPAGFTPEGLPVGIQIVGRHRAEFSVLQLAHAFEQATRAGARRPPVA